MSSNKFPSKILNAVLNKDTEELMKMRQLLRNPKYSDLWGKSYTKELGRLAQGIPGTKGTDTIMFINYNEIPLDQRQNVTYCRRPFIIVPYTCTFVQYRRTFGAPD